MRVPADERRHGSGHADGHADRANDLAQLRRELSRNDVAGVIMEPVQGMTCEVLSTDYMREAEILCDEFGAILIADEVQTGLGRTGEWFATSGNGIRPGMVTVSKTLSGGVAPVSAVMMREDVYERVFDKFTSGPIYFSTFAENNASMAASLATLDVLEKIRAPQKVEKLAAKFREGLAELQSKYDIIDRVQGKGPDDGGLLQGFRQAWPQSSTEVARRRDAGAFGGCRKRRYVHTPANPRAGTRPGLERGQDPAPGDLHQRRRRVLPRGVRRPHWQATTMPRAARSNRSAAAS